MSRFALLTAVSALALSGCGADGDNESADAANAARASRTENGQLTVRAQGVDLKINLPPPIRRMTEDDDLLPPSAHSRRGGEGRRFHSDDPPQTVADWYGDRARANRFTINRAASEGTTLVLSGNLSGGGALTVRLSPAEGGGTDGTVLVTSGN